MFLPISPKELDGAPDFVYVIGEAYCDHPSFGHAIVSRLIVSLGYTVAMLPQPQCDGDYMRFGAPRLGFLVTGGVVDSMVNNYTVAKIRRKRDVYSEGGDVGKRPDRCVDVYCRALKRLFPDVPVVIGGIEASLRRFAHYDYWSDRVLPSVLASSGADLLIYGMGERPIKDICALLDRGVPLGRIRDVRGTCYMTDALTERQTKAIERGDMLVCPSLEEVSGDKRKYVDAFNTQSRNADFAGKPIAQRQGERWLVQNAPQRPLSVKEMDEVYALPYERRAHPVYKRGVPAMEEIGFSLTSVRGCFGSCNYCALTYHQGRIVQKRSRESIVEEAKKLIAMPDFKGYIHDVGGPTANFRDPACAKQTKVGACTDRQCIGWKKCPALQVSHREYLDLLRELRELDGVKKVFVRSGIRFDYVMYDKSDEFLRELVKHHVSGQLKVAPEHVSDDVLKRMNKPPFEVYLQFKKRQARQKAISRPLSDLVAPRLYARRRGAPCRVSALNRLYARAGAGLLSHAVDKVDMHVLHRHRSGQRRRGLCAARSARKGDAARADAIPRAAQLRTRQTGAASRRTRRFDRVRQAVSDTPDKGGGDRSETQCGRRRTRGEKPL